MAQEIERKFLVIGEFKSSAFAQSHIVQGYISSARGRTVRVRIFQLILFQLATSNSWPYQKQKN